MGADRQRDAGATGAGSETRRERPNKSLSGGAGAEPPREARSAALLDTTAQLTHRPIVSLTAPCPATVLQKRARAKSFSERLVGGLVDLGGDTPLRHSYLRTQSCASLLRQENGKITGKYCGNRWCVVCNRIRTAKLYEAYLPALLQWEHRYFVTLTIPNCSGKSLHAKVRELIAGLRRVGQYVRRDGHDFAAIRKLEITYSLARGDFHPHFHLIVNSQAAADALVTRWLIYFPEARGIAQDVRRCESVAAAAELFKYFTKLTVKIDGRYSAPPARALDTIFKSMRKLRTIQPMGFKGVATAEAITDEDGELNLRAGTVVKSARIADFEWLSTSFDWVDFSTGEVLADFEPSQKFLALLDRIERDAYSPARAPDAAQAASNIDSVQLAQH